MIMRSHLAVLILLAACGLMVTISGRRLTEALDVRDVAENRLAQTAQDGRSILMLRSKEERITFNERPKEDAVALVNMALAEAGLPANRLADLRNDSDTALPRSSESNAVVYRRQSLSLSLRDISIGDLGSFLAAWETVQSAWTITRLTLSHSRDRNHRAENYDITLIITAIYVEMS